MTDEIRFKISARKCGYGGYRYGLEIEENKCEDCVKRSRQDWNELDDSDRDFIEQCLNRKDYE